MTVQCVACGMPMEKTEDFAMKDTSKNYCRFCARPNGTMQNYDEKLRSLTDFIIQTQGIIETAACATAREMMSKLPAWAGKR